MRFKGINQFVVAFAGDAVEATLALLAQEIVVEDAAKGNVELVQQRIARGQGHALVELDRKSVV